MRKTFTVTALTATLLLAACGTEDDTTNEEILTEELQVTPAADETNAAPQTDTEVEQMTTFTPKQGTIQSIEQLDGATQLSFKEGDDEFTFWLADDTPIVDDFGNTVTLTEGMTVSGYMYTNGAMVMIYPPRYTPAIVVATTADKGLYDVAAYDETLTNDTNTLKLNIDESVVIEGVEEVVAGNYAVFYGPATRSIPAQTTPTKVIAIPDMRQ